MENGNLSMVYGAVAVLSVLLLIGYALWNKKEKLFLALFGCIACVNCGRCVEACPELLILSRLAKFGKQGDMASFEAWHGLECIECGCCSFVCPSRRQVAQSIKTMKKLTLAEKRKQQK